MNDLWSDTAVLIVSDTDWSGMMLQKQRWALEFAAIGVPVCYINKTPQRQVRFDDFHRVYGLLKGRGISPGHIAAARPAPDNIDVINLKLLPPMSPFDLWNRRIVESFARQIRRRWPRVCMITYTPTPAILHLHAVLNPFLSAYICVHNYTGIPGISERVIAAERELAHTVTEVFCDARFLAEKWSNFLGRPVARSLPGCDPDRFAAAWRGDELAVLRTVGFFGSSFTELDLAAYRAALDAGFELQFIGPKSREVAHRLGAGVRWIPPVPNEDLPRVLRDIDVLMLVYRSSERNLGVIPGKFFECLATGKPMLVSDLPDMSDYTDCINIVRSPDDVSRALRVLGSDPAANAVQRRFAHAAAASWATRFTALKHGLEAAAGRATRP